MSRPAHVPAALQIPNVDAPGRLDIAVLHEWARLLATEGVAESLRRAAIPAAAVRAAVGVLPDAGHWQYPADALWFTATEPERDLLICMPPALAAGVVARCLGYDGASAHPLTGSDRRLLAHWLQSFADHFAETAGWPGRAHVSVFDGAEPTTGTLCDQMLVLFSISLSAGDEHGTVQLAAPWQRLRPAVGRQVAAAHGRLHIAPEALTSVEFPLQARIPGGTISVAETFDLAPGDVLVLDSALQGAVELRLGGRCRADGQTVAVGRLGSQNGRWAVRMTELRTDTIIGRDDTGRHTGDGQ